MFRLGIEKLLSSATELKSLKGRRVALVAHPASTDQSLRHSLDLLMAQDGITVSCAFGPQHGMRGEKQDNMIESDDYVDPVHKIPVFSLYGQVRRPTAKMMDSFDVVLVDLQDVGCRIYTFLTTLFYLMDACAGRSDKEIWVLDRPNPAGRTVEGLTLVEGYETFVGAAPLPMRHGLTLGEAGWWYQEKKGLKVNYRVIPMEDYAPETPGEWGWPLKSMPWVNPSPNMPRLTCARMYAGTVMVEGTNLSEGRGTTIPLEVFGAPGLDSQRILDRMRRLAPRWLEHCLIRPCYYEPTFHKFKGELCSGLQIHIDHPGYNHREFKPFRIVSLYFKAVRELYPERDIWRKPPYEYEAKLMPIDILSGSDELRKWADSSSAAADVWDQRLLQDERAWERERKPYLLY